MKKLFDCGIKAVLLALRYPNSMICVIKEEAEHGMIHFKNGSVIEIIESNDNMRGKRALIQPFQNADGTVDYCFNHELLDEVLAPFKKEAKDTFDREKENV